MVGYDAERLFFADPGTMTPHGYAFLPRAPSSRSAGTTWPG